MLLAAEMEAPDVSSVFAVRPIMPSAPEPAASTSRSVGRHRARNHDQVHYPGGTSPPVEPWVKCLYLAGRLSADTHRQMTNDPSDVSPAMGGAHPQEPHGGSVASRPSLLRAGVLGANDGIISTAGPMIGVAAASTDAGEIATAGVAGLVELLHRRGLSEDTSTHFELGDRSIGLPVDRCAAGRRQNRVLPDDQTGKSM